MNVKAGLGFRGNARRALQESRQVIAKPDDAWLRPVVRSGLAGWAAPRLGNGATGRAREGQDLGVMDLLARLVARFMARLLTRRPIVAARAAVALLGIARRPFGAPVAAPMFPAARPAAVRRLWVERRGGDAVDRKGRDGASDQSLDRGNVLAVLGRGEHEGAALPPGPAGAADPVHIIFGVVRHIEAEDVRQALDIEPARRDVAGDEEPDFVVLETLQRLGPLGLRHIAVQCGRVEPMPGQGALQDVDVAFAVAEDEGVLDVLAGD